MIAFGLFALIARAADSAPDGASRNQVLVKENCAGIAEAGHAQCLKQAKRKGKVESKETVWRCEDVMSRQERECMVRELERQHAGE